MDKDTKKVIKAAEKQGFEVQITAKGHAVFSLGGMPVATASGTASDHRAIKNLIAQLRRAGFQWPPRR